MFFINWIFNQASVNFKSVVYEIKGAVHDLFRLAYNFYHKICGFRAFFVENTNFFDVRIRHTSFDVISIKMIFFILQIFDYRLIKK